ncbi:MAG: cyanoexosortase B system-associated protein [Elainellaceae cyanobacterium]
MESSYYALTRKQTIRMFVALLVLAIALFTVLPNYITGNWSWANPPQVVVLDKLKQLQKEGLTFSDWQTLEQHIGNIGGRKWSIQAIEPDAPDLQAMFDNDQVRSPVYVFLRPQTRHQDQPQVEWMDLNGVQQWKTDSHEHLRISASYDNSAPAPSKKRVAIEPRYFRGWNSEGTYAVLQWYAWSDGGHPDSSRWFWADQWAQWRDRQRMPWVAVSVLIPIKPLGDIDAARSIAERTGIVIQSNLEQHIFDAH